MMGKTATTTKIKRLKKKTIPDIGDGRRTDKNP
jgi:hypothetical protein